MASPDRPEILSEGQGTQPKQPAREAGPTIDPLVSGESANILPQVNHSLFSVMGEPELRLAMLQAVQIDDRGIARLENPDSGVETIVAGVAVDSKKTATLVAFERGEQGELLLPVKPFSRFGFFVGHDSSREVFAAIRMGLYPGTPIITESVSDDQNKEVFLGLGGIKTSEVDEQAWAEAIGLYTELGFHPSRSRGIFEKFHRPDSGSDNWQARPLVALLDQDLDLVKHFDPRKVRINEFQALFYGVEAARRPQFIQRPSYYDDVLGGGYLGGMRGGGSLSYGGGLKGMGVGFGEAVARSGQTSGINVKSLEGAFQVVIVPAQS